MDVIKLRYEMRDPGLPACGLRQVSPVVTIVVQRGFCGGCGVCAAVCPSECLKMMWDPYGARVPRQVRECPAQCGLCVAVCPFGDHGVTEDDLSAELFGETPCEPTAVGSYLGTYVGYVAARTYRADGSSGGLARWFLAALLEQGHVQRVMCVVPGTNPENLFRFADLDSPEAVRGASRSAYYPTDLADVLRHAADERYAIIGLPCVAKAVRLAARHIPTLASRVTLVAGLVCGKLVTRGFAEYVTRSMGLDPGEVHRLRFREKHPGRPAGRFSVVAESPAGLVSVPMPWNIWASGEFKLRACDTCDDVFAETADIVFMDAWLPKYSSDSRGTSIIITRSSAAESVIRGGIECGDLDLQPMSIEDVLRSQAPRIRNKRHTLAKRLWMMEAAGQDPPPKRVPPTRPGMCDRLLFSAYERVRAASHDAMLRQREASPVGLETYSRVMRPHLRRLGLLRACAPTRLKRLSAAVVRRLGRVLRALKAEEH